MVNQYLRLEKIEFGGIRGQMLSDLVAEMFTEFTELSNQFQTQAKDPLDISNTVSHMSLEYSKPFKPNSLKLMFVSRMCTKASSFQ